MFTSSFFVAFTRSISIQKLTLRASSVGVGLNLNFWQYSSSSRFRYSSGISNMQACASGVSKFKKDLGSSSCFTNELKLSCFLTTPSAIALDFDLYPMSTIMCGQERVCNRSEEHTSELQSHHDLVCRLLL